MAFKLEEVLVPNLETTILAYCGKILFTYLDYISFFLNELLNTWTLVTLFDFYPEIK